MKLDLGKLSKRDIDEMSYNELIGLVRETNRPPGGDTAIRAVAQLAFVTQDTRILEIGTSTGVTAIELARLTRANITGIDINEESLEEARRRAERYGVEKRTTFKQADATKLPDADGSYDMVFCGNVTSLVSNRDQALAEYTRVLRVGGFVAAIPMYYVKTPSEKLVADVRAAIKVNIQALYKDYWMEFFRVKPLELYVSADFAFDEIQPAAVDTFVNDILRRPHLEKLSNDAKAALDEKYRYQMHLFRENLAHMGYSVMLLRKEPEPVDCELFTSRQVSR